MLLESPTNIQRSRSRAYRDNETAADTHKQIAAARDLQAIHVLKIIIIINTNPAAARDLEAIHTLKIIIIIITTTNYTLLRRETLKQYIP